MRILTHNPNGSLEAVVATQREIKHLIEAAELKHPGYHITTYPGTGQLRGLTIFHVVHADSGLETSRDSPSINGALWCVEHFDTVKTDPRFWSKKENRSGC